MTIVVGDPDSVAAANHTLAEWFTEGPDGPPALAEANRGYWDHEDATLSVINLATVSDLAAQAGETLDPLRFRANLYLHGLAAWQEFALVGRRPRIGAVELEILRPIDRCRAISVDPRTGETAPQPARPARHPVRTRLLRDVRQGHRRRHSLDRSPTARTR